MIEVTHVTSDKHIPRLEADGAQIEYWVIANPLERALELIAGLPWISYVKRAWYHDGKRQLWVPISRRWVHNPYVSEED